MMKNPMTMIGVLALAVAFGANAAEKKDAKPGAATDLAALRAAAREDMSHAVRPGGIESVDITSMG